MNRCAPGLGWPLGPDDPASTAAERERIIGVASELRASIPADHPEGARASFADYLRQEATP